MTARPFDRLRAVYPNVIAKLPPRFTSHDFILKLAQDHQQDYIEALFENRGAMRQGTPVPFMVAHSRIAQLLLDFSNLVTKVSVEPSPDIFGETQNCAVWSRK